MNKIFCYENKVIYNDIIVALTKNTEQNIEHCQWRHINRLSRKPRSGGLPENLSYRTVLKQMFEGFDLLLSKRTK